jgi:hypothetical protein
MERWAIRVKNEKQLRKGKMEKNILNTMERRKAYSIGHLVRRNCLLKQVVDGKIEVSGRRGIRRKQLLDDFKEMFWKQKMMH